MSTNELNDCREFLNRRADVTLVDVRAPIEFEQGHIPGAVNIPLFDDDERARVGTTYKQKGRRDAIRLGLDLIGPKMRSIVESADAACGTESEPGEILVYCARGGMRSDSVCWLLRQADFQATRLIGGYKKYRQYCHSVLEQEWDLVTLTGMTGTGKTRLLQELESAGEQIVDLEGMAHHRGSAFGGIGQPQQPSTEQFENLIFEQLITCAPERRIWVEDESRSVGKCVIPNSFFSQLHNAPAIRIEVEVEERLEFLVSEYGDLPKDEMVAAIERISKRLGGQHVKAAIEALNRDDIRRCAEILLVYYDKTYGICSTKNPRERVLPVDVSTCKTQTRLERVLEAASSLGKLEANG